MQLVDASEFRDDYFPGKKKPDLRTIKRWIDTGKLPGRVIACHHYVDVLALSRETGNALADSILSAGGGAIRKAA